MSSGAGRRLLVLNFAMDEDHPILGFGASWVHALAERVERLHVVTGALGRVDLPDNVTVSSIEWSPGHHVRNLVRLQRETGAALREFAPDAVFTHMAALYAAAMGPEIWIRRIRHVLWYAHVSRPKTLLLAYPWVNAIATSTPESCPLSGAKIHVVGQGIDTDLFSPTPRDYRSVERTVHWGRADPSKRIGYMLNAVTRVNETYRQPASFTQIGSPATPEADLAWRDVLRGEEAHRLLRWIPGVARDQLPALAAEQDIFLHAFTGSMDKAALEAAATGLPVLSENPSVRRELGAWPSAPDLASQLMSFVQADSETRSVFAQSQQREVIAHHSLHSLAGRLLRLIYPDCAHD